MHFAFVRTVFSKPTKKPSQHPCPRPPRPAFNLAEVATIQTLQLIPGSLSEASGFVLYFFGLEFFFYHSVTVEILFLFFFVFPFEVRLKMA